VTGRPALPDPTSAALLVIDMQEYFRPIAAPILPRLANTIRVLRRRGMPIIFTRHGHRDPERDGGMLRQWWGELIVHGSPEWQLLGEIAPEPGELVVPKTRYSAFHRTELSAHLERLRITELVIGGVMTNLCCETTAREAFVRDYRVFFLSDGTATVSEAHQQASLLNLAFGFATLLSCQALREGLG
jgi:nicotinamidase-related amidase